MTIKKEVLFSLFIVLLMSGSVSGQVVKTAAVPYTKGASPFTPNIASSSELRVDTAASQLYWWDRDGLTWRIFRPGIDIISGSVPPAYTPRDNQSLFAVNASSELFYYNSPSWVQIGGGAGAGGIYGGSGNVPDGTVATLDDDFEFSGGDISSFTVSTGTTNGGQLFSNLSGATVIQRDTSNNYLELTNAGANFNFGGSFDRLTITGRDARYAADYSGTYSARSLIDKAYGDATYKSIYTGNGTLFAGGPNVSFTGANPLKIRASGSSSVAVEQKIYDSGTTGFFDKYKINGDSSETFYALGRFGVLTAGAPYSLIVNDGELFLSADSIRQIGAQSTTAFKKIGGYDNDGTFYTISGSADGDVLAWDDASDHWEVRAQTGGAGLSDGDYGDITVSGTGTAMDIDAGVVTPTEVSSDVIVNGGNTDGGAITIGTNDAFALNIETNNVARATITGGASTGGAWTVTDVTANTNTPEVAKASIVNSSGTAAAGFGYRHLIQLESSTTDGQDAAAIDIAWTTATHASRTADIVFSLVNNAGALAEFFRIVGQATPVVRIGAGSTTFGNGSITAGSAFTVGNSGSAVTLGGSSGSATVGGSTGTVSILRNTATTNAVVPISITANTTGTAANGLGPQLLLQSETSTGGAEQQAAIASIWTDATHASRTAAITFSTVNNAGANTERARITATELNVTGNLTLSTAGNKVNIATGSNASVGTSAAMTAGTITISTTAVTTTSAIFLTVNTPGGVQGVLSAPSANIVNGTSFVINSSSVTDTSTVNWWIIN